MTISGAFERDLQQAETLLRHAVAAGQGGQHAAAARQLRGAIALVPDHGELWANLGIACRALLLTDPAGKYGWRALAILPDRPALWTLLADMVSGADDMSARRACCIALVLDPLASPTWTNLALLVRRRGDRPRALAYSGRAVFLDPANAANWNNFGLMHIDMGSLGKGRAAFELSLSIDSSLASPHANLAHILISNAQVGEGLIHYRAAIALDPGHAEALNGLAGALKDQSLAGPATMAARWAMTSDPANIRSAKTYLACLLHLSNLSASHLYDEHRRVLGRFEARIRPLPAMLNNRDKDRRLIVGYASSDLRGHPVARYLRAGFEHRDPAQISLNVYSDVRVEDAETAWYRSKTDRWRDVRGLDDAAAARLIREDKVDILVVPAAHFDDNRPLLAAHDAAPVQVSIFAGTTTGVRRSTHWLTDSVLHPEGTSERFTESLVRLPVLHFFRPPATDPPIVDPPMRTRGFVTFGCFINPARINPVVIQSWSQVLRRLPTAELVLKNRTAFQNPEIRTRYRQLFEAAGGDVRRVHLLTADDSRYDHQKRYNDLDIVLDTFPFTGASASFDALWMGVPVVTRSGWSFVQRMTESLHVPLGLQELVARSTEEYVEIAVALAQDPERLTRLRRLLRDRISGSILCDGPRYARALEAAYRSMWQRWCEMPAS